MNNSTNISKIIEINLVNPKPSNDVDSCLEDSKKILSLLKIKAANSKIPLKNLQKVFLNFEKGSLCANFAAVNNYIESKNNKLVAFWDYKDKSFGFYSQASMEDIEIAKNELLAAQIDINRSIKDLYIEEKQTISYIATLI